MNMYLVAVDKHHALLSYTSQDPLVPAIKLLASGGAKLAADKGLLATAKLLPPAACTTGFVSVSGVASCAKWMFTAMNMPLAPLVPDFPDLPPLGLAAWTTPGNLEIELVVPSAVIKGIADTVTHKPNP